MKKILKLCGLVFLATTVVAVTNADEKLLEKNADKVSQLKGIKRIWDSM